MIPPTLPAHVIATLDTKLHGLSQSAVASRATAISQTYRAGGSSRLIASDEDALAYALARMPATYAAITASLNALVATRPDFAPQSLIDAGAGPGTATLAAREAFASLHDLTLIDANASLRSLALELASEAELRYVLGDLARELVSKPSADLVIASYVVGEVSGHAQPALTDALWRAARDVLLVIEPGTPAGYARILALRERLIAQGAHVVAPCPHDLVCPLKPPDWCHFAQRLPRSRAHQHLKGATLAYEDEKFSYVALARTPGPRPSARILARPDVSKVAVQTKLCTLSGQLVVETTPRRDKAAYQAAKKRDWGDSILP